MAEFSTTLAPPVSTMGTELWYKTKSGTLTQIFGVQAIPPVITPAEQNTYRTLESSVEFSRKGVKPVETITVECIGSPDQFHELKTAGDTGDVIDWYQKMPDQFKKTAQTKPICVHWQGDLDVSFAEAALDDMVKFVLTIGKSSVPGIIDGLPSSSTI